tara:strand:- start:13252 stop:14226 length:975 start_codon:yes stop_codon:yes gene_type:complete
MKKILSLLILLSIGNISYAQVDIPQKLLLSSEAFVKNLEQFPIYRIDLIIFSHEEINKTDEEERFPPLKQLIYSEDLLELLETPNFLVKKDAIEQGLVPSTQVIKSISLNPTNKYLEDTLEPEIELNKNINKSLLPYEFFELIIDKNDLSKKFVGRLNSRNSYEVLFEGSWFQPLFNKDLSSPVYIQGEGVTNGVHGELLLYKERFLHSQIKIRLSERTKLNKKATSVRLFNFNNLVKLSKADNRFITFFKSIGEDVVSFSNWILRTKEFTPISESDENYLIINNNYKDLYEINQQTKMKENSFHYIDHPYFGAIIRISLWDKS